MNWSAQTWLLALAIVAWAALQYGLVVWALRDLVRRPRVRGDNKVVWALVILTLLPPALWLRRLRNAPIKVMDFGAAAPGAASAGNPRPL